MNSKNNSNKQFAVNWNNHMNHVKNAFDNLLKNSEFTDVTLYAEGGKIGAHKMLLSACSNYFNKLFRDFPHEHPLVVLKGVRYSVLEDILKFIYNGEVSVDSDSFDSFLQTAEFLQVSGLTDSGKKESKEEHSNSMGDLEGFDEALNAKKVKPNNIDEEFTCKEEEPSECYTNGQQEVIASIFADEISDQESSQFPSDFLLEAATPNNFEIDESNIKVEEESTEEQHYVSSDSNISSTLKSDDNLTCPICYKVFSHPYSLHHHKPVHLGRTKCPICNIVLSRKYNLKMHMKSRHNVV
ncbi:hypothetical protein JTB14_033535 [Gonioctena quinquepunctata]|nr:hypothetical protein JTB14_033535 [Gonioctena quinquepunctata]